MGAWDMGPFDNDGALDLLAALDSTSADTATAALRSAMTEVVECDDYIENPEAQGAVAAAVLVAARAGSPQDGETSPDDRVEGDVARFLATHEFEVSQDLCALATRTFERVLAPQDNEWYELWQEAGQLHAAMAQLEPFRRILSTRLHQAGS